MKSYVGIDLGTTNSAICTFDGESVRIHKSPEQNDVTPSAIFVDRRGNRFFGLKAYNAAPRSPQNAALLFKRFMGTNTPIQLHDGKLTMTPEQCSAEILRVLFGYLPEEIRKAGDTGTVITVPAAFNQMQKDATLQAAELAGIGAVAVMQEPVAAIMSVMRTQKRDGIFVVYDLGGGTLDIAVAQSIAGRVSLLAHGGIAMCGGRDFDRIVLEQVVAPWLLQNFDLPDTFLTDPEYAVIARVCGWAAERAKIELSHRDAAQIALDESELPFRDRAGSPMYLDIEVRRDVLDRAIEGKVSDSLRAAKETLEKAGISAGDVDRIVFVGGPTHYKPLRDRVTSELGIPGSTEVNPMTAVAEGAAVFAESVDWASSTRGRKKPRGQLAANGALQLAFAYIARTPDVKAKVVAQLAGPAAAGTEFQLDSLDTGWTSGRVRLSNGASVDLPLAKAGENTFKIFVFDSAGGPVALEQDRIVVTRTASTIDAIPASHSVGIEVLERVGGRPVLEWLVRAGDPLPHRSQKTFKAAESLRAQSTGSLNFKLWEGEISDPISDNRMVGTFKVRGTDFEDGVISAGTEMVLDYEVSDSGAISVEVSVPTIQASFQSHQSFYARQDGQIDFTAAAGRVAEEAERTKNRVEAIAERVQDPGLEEIRKKVEQAAAIRADEREPERTMQALDDVLEARRMLARIRQEHLKSIRQMDLDSCRAFFDEYVRRIAKPTEITGFENLLKTAQREIEQNANGFEAHLDDLRGRNFEILWRQDWFVVDRFKREAGTPHAHVDPARFQDLVNAGNRALQTDKMDDLREITRELGRLRVGGPSEDELLNVSNILRS